jgi:hypothetical protein
MDEDGDQKTNNQIFLDIFNFNRATIGRNHFVIYSFEHDDKTRNIVELIFQSDHKLKVRTCVVSKTQNPEDIVTETGEDDLSGDEDMKNVEAALSNIVIEKYISLDDNGENPIETIIS